MLFDADAFRTAARSARRSGDREVGGVLIGYRSGSDVHVRDVLVIPDERSTRTRYVLREEPREKRLGEYLAALPTGSPLGYVGTWHSHPARLGPSFVDKQTFRRQVWSARGLIALVVLAADGSEWVPYGLLGRPRIWASVASVLVTP